MATDRWPRLVGIFSQSVCEHNQGDSFMELPREFLVGVFTVAATASVVGIAGYDNYKPPLSQQQTAVIQTVQQTAPVQQAVRAPETTSEKQAKLAAMEASDLFMLAAHGYKATARLDYGNCNGSPPTRLVDPGLHYHSTSTCIEYAAVVTSGANAGRHVHIYVQHRGVSGDVTDSEFTSLKGPALPAN
jgi:hypothetical protein